MSELKEALENASVTQGKRIIRRFYINLLCIDSQNIVKIHYCSVLGNRDSEIFTNFTTDWEKNLLSLDLPWYLAKP